MLQNNQIENNDPQQQEQPQNLEANADEKP